MTTYRLIVSDEEGAHTVPVAQDIIDQSPAIKAIVERSFNAKASADSVGVESVGFDQSYNESPKHDNHHDNRTPSSGYGKSYTRLVP